MGQGYLRYVSFKFCVYCGRNLPLNSKEYRHGRCADKAKCNKRAAKEKK